MSLRAGFWFSAALALAGFAAIWLWSAPRIEAGGLAPFDTRQGGYDLEAARSFLAALTPEGRAAYLGPQRLADTLFPLGLLGLLVTGTLLGLRRRPRWLAGAAVLPALGYFVADMLENGAVAAMLRGGPEALDAAQVAWASACTLWKFRLVNLALALFVLAWATHAAAALRGRRRDG